MCGRVYPLCACCFFVGFFVTNVHTFPYLSFVLFLCLLFSFLCAPPFLGVSSILVCYTFSLFTSSPQFLSKMLCIHKYNCTKSFRYNYSL